MAAFRISNLMTSQCTCKSLRPSDLDWQQTPISRTAVESCAGVHTRASSRALSVVLGVLLLIAGVSELSGWIEHVRWGRRTAWVAGAVSGALGGLVGNQGGIRTAAMLGFDVPKEAFVATATAIALFVDVARMPVYLVTQWRGIVEIWPLLLTASGGVVVGTMFGRRALARLPQRTFRRAVAVLLVGLGLYMAFGEPFLADHRGRRRSGIDQLPRREFDAKVQPLEGARSEQHEVADLAENNLIDDALSNDVDECRSHPPFDDGTVRLSETPSGKSLDAERLEDARWKP
jgi:hypothetical protein